MSYYKNIFYTDSDPLNLSRKETIIFIHGFFMNSSLFDKQVDFFKETHRIICFDIRGFGKTIWEKESFSLLDIMEDAISLLDYLDIKKCIWVGMSMGGYIALRAALHYQERITKLILIATQADVDNQETIKLYKALSDNWNNNEAKQNSIEALLPIMFGNDTEIALYWKQIWLSYRKDNITYPMNAMLSREDINIDKIYTPTLIIHGNDDMGIPVTAAKKMYKELKNAKIFIINDAHHAVNATHHHIVNIKIKSFI